ncbi:MAG: translation initiation factor IF-2 [Gemmatimonadetes bacterium]|nr:translation initiation factor IF-2 [Gemmatimonadota bacterium]
MQVIELATDLKVDPEALIHFLRELGIPVHDDEAEMSEADVSRVLARVERERRAGHKDVTEALEAAIEDAQSSTRRRRRRRRSAPEVSEELEAEGMETEAEGDKDEVVGEEAEAETDEVEEGAVFEVEAEADADEEMEAGADAGEEDEDSDEVEAEDAEDIEADSEVMEDADEAVAEVSAIETGEEVEPEVEEESIIFEKPQAVRIGAAEGPVSAAGEPAASAAPGGQVRIQAEGYTSDGRRKKKERKKGKKRQRVDQEAVQSNIQRVLAEIKGGGKKRRKSRGSVPSKEEREAAEEEVRQEEEREATTVRVNEFLTIAELSELVDVSASEIVGSAFKNLGLMVTINQRLDFDQIEMLLEEFGFTAVREEEYGTEEPEEVVEDAPEDLRSRPPVVTVMGHVDHGKTKLLDFIRSANVVAGESGGITQHIGAYQVEVRGERSITFLDTPGHAAFTAMRARGADVTDIVVLVVAADDSVMPQTIEAISHARNAGVPLVVAVNKIDLPAANPGKVKQELLQHEVQVEEFGGEVLSAEISAKQGEGIDDLLEKVLLQAEILELKANPDRAAHGAVIEAQLDVGKGPVISVLVQTGTLRVGDSFICGLYDGRVRAMLDERGKSITVAGPGIPVQVLGSPGVPQAGDTFMAMEADRAAEIAGTRQRLEREKQLRIKERGFKLGDFSELVAEGQVATLPLIIKGDVDGSVQAVSDALEHLSTDEVQVEIIHRAVGAINEPDVLLAHSAGAVIIGFRVRPHPNARQIAERDAVDIHVYDVIYEAVDDVKAALEGMLSPEQRESILGDAEVKDIFKITGVGTIAGSYVTGGTIDRKARARVIRDGIVIYDGEFSSLKRFKDDVSEVKDGLECGIGIANFNDVKVGDLIECYKVEEVARTLAEAHS